MSGDKIKEEMGKEEKKNTLKRYSESPRVSLLNFSWNVNSTFQVNTVRVHLGQTSVYDIIPNALRATALMNGAVSEAMRQVSQ